MPAERTGNGRAVSTLRFGRWGTTMVLVCGTQNPSDHDWAIWIETYSTAAREHGVQSLFVVSRGGGPNARQRKDLVVQLVGADSRSAQDYTTAVCGNSPVVRAITSAIGWLSGAKMRSFGYEQRAEALDFLGVSASQREEILKAARRFEQELRGDE